MECKDIKKIIKAQKSLSRKKKGSVNRLKTKIKLAKKHLKISNKLSENQTVENPNMKVSAKSFNIATIMGEKKWWRTYKS